MLKLVTAGVLLGLSTVATADDDARSRPVKEPELRDELLRRVKADQDARNAMIDWLKVHGKNGVADPSQFDAQRSMEYERLLTAVRQADKENTERLHELTARHGWPTHSLVGKDGSSAAWLLVQHADLDPRFQRQCLDLMARTPKDEISLQNFAYLTDRVLLAEGKKQRYGTQFTAVHGKWRPRPLEDEANVDARRAEVGLGSLAEYAKTMETYYGPAK